MAKQLTKIVTDNRGFTYQFVGVRSATIYKIFGGKWALYPNGYDQESLSVYSPVSKKADLEGWVVLTTKGEPVAILVETYGGTWDVVRVAGSIAWYQVHQMKSGELWKTGKSTTHTGHLTAEDALNAYNAF